MFSHLLCAAETWTVHRVNWHHVTNSMLWGNTAYCVWSLLVKICCVIQIKLNYLV